MDTEAVQTTMRVIGGKWKACALLQLRGGPTRFNMLKRKLPGVTQRMLAQQLRELETDGVVSRKVLEVVPPHVEYALTAKGATLVPILNWLAEWGECHPTAERQQVKASRPDPNPRMGPAAKPIHEDPLSSPRAWRFRQSHVQSGGLTATCALADTRLVFGAASLTEADS
jgi:DNA-binding HxlR family transcriptional regulator